MHVITGLLLAGLAGSKGKKQQSPISGFCTGPVRTVHALPGRIRFRVPSLANDQNGSELIKTKLSGVDGVFSVEVSQVTGSVLLLYDEAEVQPELLFAAIVRLLGLEDELENPPPPVVARELKTAAQSLNRAVYEKTGGIVDLWTGLTIGLAGVGIRQAMLDPARAWPAGFTMVWWAANALGRQR